MSLVLVWISAFLALTHGVFALEVLSEVDTRDITLVVPAALPGTWKYQGCYTDQEPRTLGTSSYKSYNMTIENCISYCGIAEYAYAGRLLEWEDAATGTGSKSLCFFSKRSGNSSSIYLNGSVTSSTSRPGTSVSAGFSSSATSTASLNITSSSSSISSNTSIVSTTSFPSTSVSAGFSSSISLNGSATSTFIVDLFKRDYHAHYFIAYCWFLIIDIFKRDYHIHKFVTSCHFIIVDTFKWICYLYHFFIDIFKWVYYIYYLLLFRYFFFLDIFKHHLLAFHYFFILDISQHHLLLFDYVNIVDIFKHYLLLIRYFNIIDIFKYYHLLLPNFNIHRNVNIYSSTPTATGLPKGWSYAGCYTEGTTGRALIHGPPDSSNNTVEVCVNTCIGMGYTIAGLEYSSQCFCDNALRNGPSTASQASCNMPCSGNSTEMCGAGNILSIYSKGNFTVYKAPVTQISNLPGGWTYQGCYSDNGNNNRALIWQSISYDNNSATSCLKYGYMSGGMEYGQECYCGDDADMKAAGSTKQADADCSIACTGDPTYLCGGGDRLSYYKWTGTPINTFHYPNGSAMGSYSFLIGGVVIPLITTTGVNGKVMFMEKSGTGAPNTTGVYELDLNYVNNFDMAWRELHVKTDIFCAAGITLPDKVGRQLNIGGWSGPSTFGVRLYWPDGKPGTPGVNDWHENVDEVALLAGRWYPSAMIMTNGSVLVIGGEVGSNQAASPSLEILPPPAGGYSKYLDWLARTDPNNLYPFLWVLPTGGILVVYWNEARILDEKTLDTTRTLPNLPGSIINPMAGRTYPLEGTGVMLPLHAPFTDPVTILVCGGSADTITLALDNCVSTQPEVPNSPWVIERMPSRRVMSCMVALPDGTFLILNGAQNGVAGFGLATNPNYNAVLYDPTLPVNQRFSVMATTIVARLYHSEAILLQDGRVLVSGSDPQDTVHPEEYRVEVFSPPYTLSGLPAPSFNISNIDWSYGGKVSITANIPSGKVGSVRVSMLAAVSSTHGNSMGQRTLFLDVTCTGGKSAKCTMTAPPNAHVAPPGWYMIFVLDGPMPGPSHWIRIGGEIADAAGLGNWPNASDWQTPGLGKVNTYIN
ncbi:WSC domain-containing protein [Rutstroemia sp. NJR-2017a BBW]|nr:WSC domain-containing protein [Rutstroemia sp. NJR-2017a BBW]